MPKEILFRLEVHGQVWFEPATVNRVPQPEELQNPQHQEKGIRHSPFQKDNFPTWETE